MIGLPFTAEEDVKVGQEDKAKDQPWEKGGMQDEVGHADSGLGQKRPTDVKGW